MDIVNSFTELPADYEEKEKYDAYANPMNLGLIICAKVTYIITVIGLVLNGLFALFMILPISYSRRSPIRLLSSRLWLTFGILVAQTIQLLLTSSSAVLMNSRQVHRNRVLCILVSCVPESLDFITNLMITLLSFNLLIVVQNVRLNSTRKLTNLLTMASLVAWIIGFVIAFSITAPFVNTTSGWCEGTLPLYMSLIRAFIGFLVPYICSITAIRFILKAWYERRKESIVEAETDRSDRDQATQGKTIVTDEIQDEADNTKAGAAHYHGQILASASTPSCSRTDDVSFVKTDPGESVDTSKGRDFDIQAGKGTNHREMEKFYVLEETDNQLDFNTPVTEGASKTSDLSGLYKENSKETCVEICKPVTEEETWQIKIDSSHTADVNGNLELENLNRRSLGMWIVFNTVIVLFGFLSRFLLRLPIADIFSNMATEYHTYMCVAALLYSVNMACVPLLCFIIWEVRHAFNLRVCKLWLKILCWGCDCCVDVDKDME